MPDLVTPARTRLGDVLTFGFGITLAMWAAGYVCRLPPALVPNQVLFGLLLACMVGGGFLAGRHSPRGSRAGVYAGLVAGALNLLILAGLITQHAPGGGASAAVWIPGSWLFTAALAGIGGLLGGQFPAAGREQRQWGSPFCLVAASTTLLLIVSGGLVTGFEAGLAVPDWPNTFGSFMFMYPLAKMSGGIFYEHTHRLYGTLVGLATVAVAVYLWISDRRGWIRALALVAMVMVVAQGIMGGLRVTGRVTMSQEAEDLAPSIALAIVHGVFGQMFFGLLVCLTAFTTPTWKSETAPCRARAAGTDRALSTLLVVLILVQLALGALVRHIYQGVQIHVTTAVIVFILGMAVGCRAWWFEHSPPVIRRFGCALVITFGVQLMLGFGALIVSGSLGGQVYPYTVQVPFTSAHQVAGAVLLALAVSLAVWNRRLLAPVPDGQTAEAH